MIVFNNSSLKNYILSNYDQLEIFSYYLGIPYSELEDGLIHKRLIVNLARYDRKPSLQVKDSLDYDGVYKIRVFDFGDIYYRGDIFDIASVSLNLDVGKTDDFVAICKDIMITFKGSISKRYLKQTKFKPRSVKAKKLKSFDVTFREFLPKDIRYWTQYGLTTNDLYSEFVRPVYEIYLPEDNKRLYEHKQNDVCYSYFIGIINGIKLYKFYFPDRGKDDKLPRFITNNRLELEGVCFIKANDTLVITKSRKDAILIKKILKHLKSESIEVVNVSGEAVRLEENIVEVLHSKFNNIFINLDFDNTGIVSTIYHRRKYNFIPLMLTDGRFGSKRFEAKDISDYVSKFGYNSGVKIISQVINDYKL